jgi:Flp pilus assembly protein TadD
LPSALREENTGIWEQRKPVRKIRNRTSNHELKNYLHGYEAVTETTHQRPFDQATRLFALGRLAEAAEQCRVALASAPDHAPALHMLGLVLANDGKLEEGLRYVERAARLEPRQPAFHAAWGRLLVFAGRNEAAIAVLEQSLKLEPDNPDTLHTLAIGLRNLGRWPEAEASARRALALRPEAPDLLDNLGVILWQRGGVDAARRCFEQALLLSDTHPGALANLALLSEQTNQLETAETLARKGLDARPDALTPRLVLGRCQRRRHDYAAARRTLESLAGSGTDTLQKDAAYELALCADAMQESDAAFHYARRANRLAQASSSRIVGEAENFLDLIARLQRQFTPHWVSTWHEAAVSRPTPPITFMIGFPRSGTTLLDTMLGAHPQVTVLEERPALQRVLDRLNQSPLAYPERLADLSADVRSTLVQTYLEAAACPGTSASLLLDKSPFHTVHAGLIARLFPGTPILFVVRHPCDVVWSCFMTNFDLNAGTAHFTALESTVRLYCSVMSLWKTYTEVLDLNWQQVRYEDLLADPEAVLRKVTAFIGLQWSSQLLDHVTHAVTRDPVRTASYAQIGKPLYYDARGRWHRYRRYLEPSLQALQPWCEWFGYDI